MTNRTQFEQLMEAGRLDLKRSSIFDSLPRGGVPISCDKMRGMLIGLAIGDSLGNTSESLLPATRMKTRGEVRDYIKHWKAGLREAGLPSDDTQMAFWTVESVLEHGGINLVDLAEKFTTRQIYGRGQSVGEFVKNYQQGMEWPEASSRSAGNGALMRIAAVLSAHHKVASSDLWIDTALCAAVTHNDRASISACLAFVGILEELLSLSKPPEPDWWVQRYVEYASPLEGNKAYQPRGGEYVGKFSGTLSQFVLNTVPEALARDEGVVDACNRWYSGAYLFETVPSALMILSKYASDPEEAIIRAVNDTKDNDTIAAIVGAAVGALHGEAALPKRWIDGLLGRTASDDDGKIFELLDVLTTNFE